MNAYLTWLFQEKKNGRWIYQAVLGEDQLEMRSHLLMSITKDQAVPYSHQSATGLKPLRVKSETWVFLLQCNALLGNFVSWNSHACHFDM